MSDPTRTSTPLETGRWRLSRPGISGLATRPSWFAALIPSLAVLGCAGGPGTTDDEGPERTVLTRQVAETYLAYRAGECDQVLERTADTTFDARATEAAHGELLVRGFCLERSGNTTEARSIYDRLSVGAPLSFAALDARERLRILQLLERDPEYAAWVRTAEDRAGLERTRRAPVDRVSADFPPVAHALGLEGYAVVEFGVMPDGRTDAPLVVDASPPLLFDGAALRAVRQWRYARDSRAAKSERQVVRIIFRSPKTKAPTESTASVRGPAAN